MHHIFRNILCAVSVSVVMMGAFSLSVHAQEEAGTAGSTLGKEVEEYQDTQTYSRARAVEGWIYNQNNGKWWYQYSDGSWPSTSWRRINGSWYYFDGEGYWVDNNTYETGSIKGIDVSQWQGAIDWQAVKNDGIQFAFVRAGHGDHTLDTYFQQNMMNAAAAGIPTGVYFYSTAQNEAQAVQDAQFVIRSMKGYLVSYPVVIDLEDSSQAHLNKQQIGKIAKAFCDEIRTAGYTPMVYCNENWYRNMIDVSVLSDVEMWVARWGNTYSSDIPRDVWQSCSTGRVAGINGNVDIDFGYLDYTKIITPRTEPQEGYVMTGGMWVKDSIGWWYQLFAGGYPANEWQNIGGVWYWFDVNGYMATGWRQIGGNWYYMNGSGAMTTGWQLIGNVWYYLGTDGKMLTGLQEINGAKYYFDGSGAMKTGWVWIGNECYYFDGSGAMAIDTWIGEYYVDENGIWVQGMVKPGWILSGGRWWYRHSDGGYTTSGWEYIGGSWYYFDASGWIVTGWQLVDGTWYYLNGSGAMYTGWLLLGNTWYYLESDGKMAVGLTEVGGRMYYLDGSGAMHTGWVLLENIWYYFDGSGAMYYGWLWYGNVWYYLLEDGKMAVGSHEIDGVTYEFASDGRMIEK